MNRSWSPLLLAFVFMAACRKDVGPDPELQLTPDVIAFAAVNGGANPTPQNVVITEPGGRSLTDITVTITYGGGEPTGWLNVTLGGTSAPATMTLNATTGTLAAGQYSATVEVAAPLATNSPLALPVTFQVASPGAAVISLSTNTIGFGATAGGSNPPSQTVSVTNSGVGVLNLGVGTITYGAGQPTGWLVASLNQATAPANLTLTAALGSLGAGTYTATVPVTSTNGVNSPQNVTVGFLVQSGGGGGGGGPPNLINPACNPYPTPTVPAPLRTFYVDAAGGNDAANGTTPATAWKTLPRANNAVQPGDLVLVRGVFSNQNIRPIVSGTATNKIVYRVLPGDSARITIGQFDVALWLDGRSHIVVDGFEINNVINPFLMRFGASNNWLFNLYIHDTGGSIISGSDDNRVEGSRILRVGSEANNSGDAIFIQDGADRNIIVRNEVGFGGHGTIWVSFQSASEQTANDNVIAQNDTYNPWASGMGLNGKAVRTIVECNRIHHSADGTGINYARTGLEIEGIDNIIRFNELYRSGAFGMTVQGRTFGGFLQHATGNLIYGNTFWRNGRGSIELVQRDNGTVRNNIFENNIHWNDAGMLDQGTRYTIVLDMFNANSGNILAPGNMGGNIVRHSIFPPNQTTVLMVRKAGDGGNTAYNLAAALATFTGWTNITTSDPLFTNEAQDNVILQTTSPAINAGRVISNHPFLGSAPDLGARERQ